MNLRRAPASAKVWRAKSQRRGRFNVAAAMAPDSSSGQSVKGRRTPTILIQINAFHSVSLHSGRHHQTWNPLSRNELRWRGGVNITTPLVAAEDVPTLYRPQHKVRFITATSLFDGHDAAINLVRRLLQATGVEVIHLGHNRSVDEIVTAAIQEDVNGIAVTSYQGGHIEFFKYMLDLLRAAGADEIKVFGGGGGVIAPKEMAELHEYGVTRLYSPEDGQAMGLQGMINDVISRSDFDVAHRLPDHPMALTAGDRRRSDPSRPQPIGR